MFSFDAHYDCGGYPECFFNISASACSLYSSEPRTSNLKRQLEPQCQELSSFSRTYTFPLSSRSTLSPRRRGVFPLVSSSSAFCQELEFLSDSLTWIQPRLSRCGLGPKRGLSRHCFPKGSFSLGGMIQDYVPFNA